MAQQSVKARNRASIPLVVTEEVSVSQSGQRSEAGRSKDLLHSHRRQQLRNQRLHQPDSIQAWQTIPPSAQNEKSRRSVELPPKPFSVEATYEEPSFQIKAPSKSDQYKRMKVTRHGHKVKAGSSAFQDRQSDHPKRPRRKTSPFVYVLRLLILGVGVGAIAGTLLSVLEPTSRLTAKHSLTTAVQKTQPEKVSDTAVVPAALKLSQEILPLKTKVQQLAAKNVNLMPGVFLIEPDSGSYLDLNGSSTFSAASMIKFPILVAFFQDVDAGKVRLDEVLILKQQLIGGGSGDMQYQRPGTKFTALETVKKMITISDNTATNMVIARLGGAAALNQRFQNWGLTATQIRNPLPDLPGTNTTSPKDLANLMALVNQGDLVSIRSRDRLLEIMRQTRTNTLLTPGLGQGATIAHKTGDIGSLVGDVGLVDMPSGKRYIAVAMVKRPYNDSRAQELIRSISRATYQEFNKPALSKTMPTTPFVKTEHPLENPVSVDRKEEKQLGI